MSFILSDLVIESILRDGIENIKQRPEILDDVFGEFTKPYNSRKYGQAEIEKIRTLITGSNNTEIAIIHSMHLAAAKSPAISIQLGNDNENKSLARIDDYIGAEDVEITDAPTLNLLTKVTNLTPTSYDPLSGKVSVSDSVDLSSVNARYVYVDGAGIEFVLLPGISNTPGDKFFFISKAQNPDIVNPGTIKSFITENSFESRATMDNVSILLGVHTKDALLTKYIYILVKYILKSRKADLEKRCFTQMTISGSDFTRDMAYEADVVYTRFLTINGIIEDTWRSDQVDLIDCIDIDGTPVE